MTDAELRHPAHVPSPQSHEHAPLPTPSRQGSVVLDIGAGTGALVIHTTEDEDGLEIHVSPHGLPRRRTHAAVRPRHLPGQTLYAAVITPLRSGDYTVWGRDDTAQGTTTITDGQVSHYRWTCSPPAAEPASTRHSRPGAHAAQPLIIPFASA